MIRRNILIGGFIGFAAELIYLFSVYKDYPYEYIYILFPLSFLEGTILFYFLDRFRILENKSSFLFSSITYLIVRIFTRIVAVTIGTGVGLIAQETIQSETVLKGLYISTAFLADVIMILLIFTPITFAIRLIMKRAKVKS